MSLRCVACGGLTSYIPSTLPPSADRQTMTWTCHSCRTHKSAMVTITCAHCGEETRRDIKGFDPSKAYHCSRDCRWAHHRKKAKTWAVARVQCPICYQQYQAGQKSFAETIFRMPRSRARRSLPKIGRRCCTKKHARLHARQVKGKQRTCPICQTQFLPHIENQVHCSKTCGGVGRKGKAIATPLRDSAREEVCDQWVAGTRSLRQLAKVCHIDWRTVKQILLDQHLITVNEQGVMALTSV